jgi:hypothetical protein
MSEWLGVWKSTALFRQAFDELKPCMEQAYRIADQAIRTGDDVPPQYRVKMGPIPDRYYQLRHNLFSTLFQSVYQLLDIERPRRLLYGGLNLCFRVWVTAADNLLDNEDKVVIPLEMPGDSRIMRQVINIMAGDRMLYTILEDGAARGILTREEVTRLQMGSLQILLPSAAQEASEEGGVKDRPRADDVLSTIHKFKTGLLFHLPFLGIETIEHDIDPVRLETIKAGLMDFGLGCQILDDIRDIARDLDEQNHNYVLSTLYWEQPDLYASLVAEQHAPGSRLYQELPKSVTTAAAKLGFRLMHQGLKQAFGGHVDGKGSWAEKVALGMFHILDLETLATTAGSDQ